MKLCGLFRRRNFSDLLDVTRFIVNELESSGRKHGYRWMHLKCIQSGYNVTRDNVYMLLKILYSDGVKSRKRRRLKRGHYHSKGPNYVWHIDSHDMLKPYGLAINGCIDGFSRNIIWMEGNITNSDPKVIANYYIKAVQRKGGCPENMSRSWYRTLTWNKCKDSCEEIMLTNLLGTKVFFMEKVPQINELNGFEVYYKEKWANFTWICFLILTETILIYFVAIS